MHLFDGLLALSLVLGAVAFKPASTIGTDKLAKKGLANLAKYELQDYKPQQCNTKTASIRREWSSLSGTEKKEYIDAVLCLQSKPANSNSAYPAPGARSRYDDFVATHINQTLTIHGTGNFLSWHRYYTWVYEQALRNECGYRGHQPYVNWGRYAENLHNAPFFDGSTTSLSNNGAYIKHDGTYVPSAEAPVVFVPPGRGGGCVTKGPFKDMRVNLGPVAPALAFVEDKNPETSGLGYNPRCLRRDSSAWAAKRASTDKNTTDLITQNDNIRDFQDVMEGGFNQGLELLGVHTAGHFWVAGDPGGDLFASPGGGAFGGTFEQWGRKTFCEVVYNAPYGTSNILAVNAPASIPLQEQDCVDRFTELIQNPDFSYGGSMEMAGWTFQTYPYSFEQVSTNDTVCSGGL